MVILICGPAARHRVLYFAWQRAIVCHESRVVTILPSGPLIVQPSAAVLSQNLVMASNFKRRTLTISNFRPHGKHFGFTTSNRTMIRCALALVLAGNFWSKAIAECLSDPALDAIFAGGTTIPLEGSCCQNDVCNIPCPEPVPAPGSGKSVRGYRVTLTVLDCTLSSLVHQTHVLFAFSLTLVCVPPY